MKLPIRNLLPNGVPGLSSPVARLAVLAALVVLGLLVWRWTAGGTVGAVRVSGQAVLSADSVRTLSGLAQGQALRTVDAEAVAARLEQHAWIAESTVQPRPFRNRVDISVRERVPQGRWVAPDGTPRFFVDAEGIALPTRTDTTFDVPLVYDDSVSYHATEPVVRSATRQALRALSAAPTAQALTSGLHTRADHAVALYVTHPEGYTITARLGHPPYPTKLQRLEAFFAHVLPGKDDPVRTIDLRFDNQVVTQP